MSRRSQKLVWLCLLPVAVAFAQQQTVSENLVMERYGAATGNNMTIHEGGTILPDGTRSFSFRVIEVHEPDALRVFPAGSRPVIYPSDSLSDSDKALRARVCASTAIVVGKEVGSTSAVTDNKLFIYTKHQVQVTSVVRGPADITAGQTIYTAQPGGSVVDGGERVSLVFPQLIPSVVGEEYFYFLARLPDGPPDLFVPPLPHMDDTMRVSPDGLVPEPGADDSFYEGESVQAAADHIHDLLAEVPCSAR